MSNTNTSEKMKSPNNITCLCINKYYVSGAWPLCGFLAFILYITWHESMDTVGITLPLYEHISINLVTLETAGIFQGLLSECDFETEE